MLELIFVFSMVIILYVNWMAVNLIIRAVKMITDGIKKTGEVAADKIKRCADVIRS